ncbi:hypothetical protein AB0B28_02055 [Glycomyces sp. NPDC046736]|uniref:hypothetical protein n=1 Tax=Glycomyces sp. NPDC046736 TaxID=3155615 RepID=UPI0033E8B6E2
MSSTTIRHSGLSENSKSGPNANQRPGVPAYLEQVLYASPSDSDSPGAYRYDPESYDPTIPDSDPRSPRYEPPHLRHQPGDTWIIDRNRPYDPADPGPYGSPGWYPDQRTGRHRRGELPDAIPDSDTGSGPSINPAANRRPSPGPTSAEPESPRSLRGRPGGDPPQPPSRPRKRYWGEEDDNRRYDFGNLREQAWTRFLRESQELHAANLTRRTDADRPWTRIWSALYAFILRVLTPTRRTARQEAAPATVKLKIASPLAAIPQQTPHRDRPVNPYLAQWERHFDAAHGFREAVAL